MSTPNPTHIIAGHHVRWWSKTQGHSYAWCWCGEEFASVEIHAEHVVSKLTDAGYSIMPNVVLAELIDSDKCSFDHNGGCQAHGHFPPDEQAWTCPVEDAKNILAAAVEEGQ